MASMILGSLGSSLLGPLGGFIGSAIGSAIDNWILASLAEPQEGPRLDDLSVVRADPGVAIPLVFGADRIPGIMVGSTELIETTKKERVGKGGGQKTITYSYHVDCDFMLCEGPILGIARIWADGNLWRGTRQQLEVDTKKHPENIGGIPYPPYYRDHLYEPSLIPWSIDRDNNIPVDDGNLYYMALNNQDMLFAGAAADTEIPEGYFKDSPAVVSYYDANPERGGLFGLGNHSSGERELLDILYWKDTSTGYYIPITERVGYTGEKITDVVSDEVKEHHIGNGVKSRHEYNGEGPEQLVMIDVRKETGSIIDEQSKASIAYALDINIYAMWGITQSFFYLTVNCYGEGNNVLVDTAGVGELLATKTEESSNENYQGITSSISLDVPVGTAFIQVICDYVMFFPIFTDIQVMSGEGVLTYTESAASQARNWPDYWNLYSAINDFSPVAVLTVSGPTNITVYPGKDDQPSDPTMEASLNEKYPGYINRAHVVFDELQLEDFGNRIPNMMFEVVQYDDMRLSRALEELMGRAGVAEDNYDISGIPPKGVASHVLGYSIGSKTNYRAAMETLLEAFRIDVAEIGDELVFRQRNRQPDYIIDRRHIAATVAGSKPGAKVKLTYRDEVEMPRVLNVKFKDPERDYQQNNTIYRRQQGVSVGDTAVELAAVMPPHIAKEYARDKMRDIWLERVSAGVSLPHEYIYIFPSDIVFVDGQYTNDDSFTMKVTSAMRGANGLLEIEGVLRETTIYIPPDDYDEQSSMSDTWTGGQTSTTNVPGTVLALFDLPPIGVDSEEENTFGFYYAMGGSPGWRGGTVYRDTFEDGTYRGLGSSDNPATMGQTLEAPGFGTVDLLDTENTILVRMRTKSDELFSITATELLNGFNSAIVGNEIIQFMTAELIESRVYRLSNLLRGRRNTDLQSIVSGHTTGETFILLDGAGLRNYKDTAILAGLPLDYRGVAYGASVSDVPDVSFTNTDLRRTPRPPVWVRSERDGSNNITIEWYRQDRVHAIWERYADLRLGEDTEAYEIDIMSGATVVRTITGLTAPLAVYTATDQTTDGFVAGDPVEVKIYQMSAAIGRGIPAEEIV